MTRLLCFASYQVLASKQHDSDTTVEYCDDATKYQPPIAVIYQTSSDMYVAMNTKLIYCQHPKFITDDSCMEY